MTPARTFLARLLFLWVAVSLSVETEGRAAAAVVGVLGTFLLALRGERHEVIVLDLVLFFR